MSKKKRQNSDNELDQEFGLDEDMASESMNEEEIPLNIAVNLQFTESKEQNTSKWISTKMRSISQYVSRCATVR